jgi:hypothetical protein
MVCQATAFWVMLTASVMPVITTCLEVIWVGDCDGVGDPTGVDTVGTVSTGLGIEVGTAISGTVASGSDMEDPGKEISSLSPKILVVK